MDNMSVVEVIKHYQRSIEKCSGNQERMLHCISKLYRLPVTVQHLQDTGVGRTVNALRKYEGDTGEAAKALVAKWKAMVAAEDSTDDEERQEDAKDVGKEEEQVQKHHKSHKDKVSRRERSSSKSHREEEKSRSHEEKSSKSSSHDHQSKKRKYEEENGKATEKRRKKQEVESDSSEQEDIVETAEQDEDEDEDDDSDRDSGARSTSQTSQNMDSSDSETSPPPRVRDREKHNSHRKHKDRSSSKDRTLSRREEHSRREQHSRKEDSRQKEEHSRKEDHSRKEEHSRKEDSRQKEEHSWKEDHSRKEEHSRKEDHSRKEEHSRKEDHSRKDEHSRKEDSSRKVDSRQKEEHSRKEHKRKEEHNQREEHIRKGEHSQREEHVRKGEHSQREEHVRKGEHSQREEHIRKGEHSQREEHIRKGEHSQREEHVRKGEHSRKETASLKEDSHKSEKVKVKTEPKQKSTSGSHSNIPESPSKSKEKVKVKKERTEDGVGMDGIDCSTGASFAEALGMVDPVAKKKPYSSPGTSSNCSTPRSSNKTRAESVTPKKKERSVPSSPADLGLLSPNVKLEPLNEVEVDLNATLPAITPNYKPLPHYNRLDSPPHRKTVHLTEEEALCQVMSTKNKRTKVFSGGKSKVRVQVPSLYDICVRVLQENIEALEYTGGVPYDLLKPVLLHVTAEQLFALEHHNPYLIEDTDELWQFHCQREFRTKQRQDMETAREMYLRCLDEREAKLKALTSNIQQSIANSTPVRQTKLAYVDSVAKPPRNVARQQARYGTARVNTKPTPVTKAARPSGAAATSAAVSVPAPRTIHTGAKAKPRMAPLMQKTMKLVKSFNKR